MPGSTSLGFPYPLSSDYAGTGADVPRAVKDLADSLNAYLNGKYKLLGIINVFQGTTSYTPTSGADGLYIEMVGGGGAGGGCITAATNSAAAGGGGGAGYAALFTTTIKTFTVQVGAGGAGASGAIGGSGTSSTFDSPSICTATGGSGGNVHTVTAPPVIGGSGGLAGAGTLGDLISQGQPGTWGFTLAAAQALGGIGGPSHWGGGSPQRASQGNGGAASVYGAGGAGGVILSGGANVAGGNGGNGLIRVWEWQKS